MRFNVCNPFLSNLRRLSVPKSIPSVPGSRFLPESLSQGGVSGTKPCRVSIREAAIRRMSTSNQNKSSSQAEYENFFRYTSGRWVWDEEQQLRDRYKVFNVSELQRVAVEAVGSGSCVSMTKFAEGGYNKVFRLLMDDGKTVLARIPNPNAGPPFYTTASEVATMELVS
jgi:hypothetical protein